MSDIKNVILAVHGLGAHSGWFDNLKVDMNKYGIDFYAYDLPGFGQNHMLGTQASHYVRGHIDSYQEWINFVEMKYFDLKKDNPNARITILGHSLGAVLASCVKLYSGDNLILSVPGFKGASKTFNPFFVINTLWKYLVDKCLLGNDVYIEMPVSEKMQQTPAATDPLRVGFVTQTLLFEILRLGKQSKKNIRHIMSPVFMIQIEEDQVVDNKTQTMFFEMIPSPDKAFKSFSGADHDWIWYPIREDIAKKIAEWLNHL